MVLVANGGDQSSFSTADSQENGSDTTSGFIELSELDEEALDETAAFQAKVLGAIDLLQANNLNRMILYGILRACEDKQWPLHELEDYIQEQPDYASATQPPYFLISWLVEREALDALEIDQEGNLITSDMKEGLSEDEIDDLVADLAFSTTEVGRMVIEEFSPASRLIPLMQSVPDRYDTYVEVLEFLQEKHSYLEVDRLLRGRDVLMSGREANDRPMQPSVFVDKLAQAGSISFNNGWVITKEGKEILDTILKEREK